MTSNTKIIKEFIACWSNLNPEEIANYFTEDGCYFNMPTRPVKGRKAIEQFVKGFIATWTATDWEIINIVESGNLVFCERLDKTKMAANAVDLPCMGIFEMEDGKIKEWRDYFDLATYTKALSK